VVKELFIFILSNHGYETVQVSVTSPSFPYFFFSAGQINNLNKKTN
jgi:hypothetical protein